jgi:alkylhydroperoxidase/carboxymuconolactone decarboxylase family protein YurZ
MNHRRGRAGFAEWLASITAQEGASGETAAGNIEESGLDARTHALVRLAALVAAGAPGADYDRHIATALDHGVTPDEVVGVLVALLPTVGTAQVSTAAHAVRAAIDRVAADMTGGHSGSPAPYPPRGASR